MVSIIIFCFTFIIIFSLISGNLSQIPSTPDSTAVPMTNSTVVPASILGSTSDQTVVSMDRKPNRVSTGVTVMATCVS
ncbi:hypothetical protein Hdeb2414_s0013g00403101 [Helianthus debilis subsp. tardiflorus]